MKDELEAIVAGLLVVNEQMAVLVDAADGFKADMEKRGWSPTAAESAALTYLTGLIAMTLKPHV